MYGTSGAPTDWSLQLSIWIGIASLAFVVAHGHQVLLPRVASRSAVGATMMGRVLAAAGLTLWAILPVCTWCVGSVGAIKVMAIALAVLGGLLILRDPGRTASARRWRLTTVVVSATTVMVLLALS